MFHVLVDNPNLIVRAKVGGECREAQGWKEGVLDRPPVGTRGFRERGQYGLDAQVSTGLRADTLV